MPLISHTVFTFDNNHITMHEILRDPTIVDNSHPAARLHRFDTLVTHAVKFKKFQSQAISPISVHFQSMTMYHTVGPASTADSDSSNAEILADSSTAGIEMDSAICSPTVSILMFTCAIWSVPSTTPVTVSEV